jgi:hypothetical protein
MTVAPPQRASCAASDPTAPSTPCTTTTWSVTGPSAKTARCAVMPVMPRLAASSSDAVRQLDGELGRHHDGLRRRAELPVGLRAVHQHPATDAPGVDARTDSVDDAGAVPVRHDARVRHRRAQPARAFLDVARVHARERQRHRHLAGRGIRLPQLTDLEHLSRGSLPLIPGRPHAASIPVARPARPVAASRTGYVNGISTTTTGERVPVEHVSSYSFDLSILSGNVESFVGVAQVPIGLAGPLLVQGEEAQQQRRALGNAERVPRAARLPRQGQGAKVRRDRRRDGAVRRALARLGHRGRGMG